jgi:protein-tyrosine phosphatase
LLLLLPPVLVIERAAPKALLLFAVLAIPQVLDFGFPDHSACPLALLFQVVEAMKKWLSEDEENVAVVHCLAGTPPPRPHSAAI